MSVISFESFLPNPDMLTELMNQQSMVDAFDRTAQAVAEEARNLAPVLTSAYYDSIEGVVGFEEGKLVARVIASDYKAWWIEAGTEDTPAFAPLARGAEAVGYHLEAESGSGPGLMKTGGR